MNISKKSFLRNLTNDELLAKLKESFWYDKDLVREYKERVSGERLSAICTHKKSA